MRSRGSVCRTSRANHFEGRRQPSRRCKRQDQQRQRMRAPRASRDHGAVQETAIDMSATWRWSAEVRNQDLIRQRAAAAV
eukprot:54206-Eustigmatos_ZCMA.PRE.1